MSPTPSLRVFVVENHDDTLTALRYYLEDFGHQVESAQSVSEALEKLPHSRLQVLICDIGLPDGTGWELLAKANLAPTVFAIATSGFGLTADKEKSVKAGFKHHLLKPFASEELEKVLAEAISEVSSGSGKTSNL